MIDEDMLEDPDDRRKIIENSVKAMDRFGHCAGSYLIELDEDELEAILDGRCVAITVGFEEHSIFIVRKE